ncbi:Fic/DOC family protein [Rummeliibacillus sp. NPDC094406]|uniref:Fic/DOC family protein n=1 Tax=Rummeliibacillus sp. NPDC094406 TaxID=3364511 RepID=UPI0038277917
MEKYNTEDNEEYLLKTNLLGIQNLDQLEEAEAFSFSIRALQIEQGSYTIGDFTLNAFLDLHKHLFQDIYTFAGQFRDVQLMKGTTRFCQFQHLHSYSTDLFQQIIDEAPWNSLDNTAKRLAFFKSELNMLHPFREGNGRTIRIFLRAFALSKGIIWSYDHIDREYYLKAMIHSVTNNALLEELFLETIKFAK